MARDLSKNQFRQRLIKYGFISEGFLGYYKLPKPFDHISVSRLNGGDTYRGQLAYLLSELSRAENEAAAKAKATG